MKIKLLSDNLLAWERQLKRYERRWKSCRDCGLCETAKTHVLYRGTIPFDFLFVGEAPGPIENAVGKPFLGPAGKVLDQELEASDLLLNRDGRRKKVKFNLCITNTVACFPSDGNGSFRTPEHSEMLACSPRVEQLLQINNFATKGIILLGKSAEAGYKILQDRLDKDKFQIPLLKLYDPSYLLRRGGKVSAEFKRDVRKLATFIRTNMES